MSRIEKWYSVVIRPLYPVQIVRILFLENVSYLNNFGVLDLKKCICLYFGISSTIENIILVVPFPQFTCRETLWTLTLS